SAPQVSSARKGLANYSGLLVTVAAVGIMAAIYFNTRKATSDADAALTAMAAVKETSAPAVKQPQPSVSFKATTNPVIEKAQTNISSAHKLMPESKQIAAKNSITEK